jgi:ATP-dependent HslUV protease, peptidase subunit HslV
MLPSASTALARLLARQRAHLLATSAAWHQQQSQQQHAHIHTSSPSPGAAAEYSASAVGGPGAASTAATTSAATTKIRATTILAVRLGGEVVLIGDGQATANDFVVKPNVRKLRRLGPSSAAAAAQQQPPAQEQPPPTPPSPPPRLSETAASASPVVAGFAGLAADGLALLDRLDTQVHAHPGQLRRACVELAKMWRSDRALRELDAAVLVADADATLWLAGNGDVLESADGVVAVGSGSDFAEAAARALIDAAKAEEQEEAGGGVGGGGGADASAAAVAASAPPPRLTALEVARRAMRIAADSCVYTNHRWTWCRLRRVEDGEEEGASAEGTAAVAVAATAGAPADASAQKSKRRVVVVVDEGSEDGLATTEGMPASLK